MAREKICGIYKITNLVNGKVYIGQSVDIYKRWKSHKWSSYNKNCSDYDNILHRAFRKYGEDKFSFEIIEECSEEELNEKEIYYIKEYNSYVKNESANGYNLTIGGDGTRGRVVTEEQLVKMSQIMKGKFAKGMNPNALTVICEGKVFDTILECSEYYDIPQARMASWLRGGTTMPKEWYDKGLRLADKTMEDYTVRPDNYIGENSPLPTKPIICDDEIFYSLSDFLKKYPECKNIYNWLNGISSMPKEWEERGLKYLDGHTDNIIIYQDEDYWERVHKNRSESHKGYIPTNSFKVYCEDMVSDTIPKCAEYYGINPGTMKHWVNGSGAMPQEWYDKGLRREDKEMSDYKVQTQSKSVICDGVKFKSITDCAKHHKISDVSIQKYLNKETPMPKKFYDMKLHYEKDIFEECGYEMQNEYGGHSKIVICEGIEYPNVKPCAEHYGVHPGTMSGWLGHRNKMPKKFYDLGLHYKDEPMENYEFTNKVKSVVCEELIFESISDCANHYKVKNFTMARWLNGDNSMPQEFKDKGLRYYNN